jgi:hypothetical protein
MKPYLAVMVPHRITKYVAPKHLLGNPVGIGRIAQGRLAGRLAP